ncbi:MAG TPA: thioredoxin family protein [Bdellovibrionota bacterium]|jgi:peroxiredoxin
MAKTPSTMLELETEAPDFSLKDAVTGKTVSRTDFKGKPLLVMFICNHCPFVKHVAAKLAEIGTVFQEKGMGVVAINSNDISTHPDDSPENMRIEARASGYTFPYLFDETQRVAQAYQAACTPDFYLFDRQHRLVYRGQLDGSRPGNNVPVTGQDLMAAAELLLGGGTIPPDGQKASLGCNIKWKKGNEPAYYQS